MSKKIRQNQESANSPRWLADLESLELSELQSDGSYKVAYDMVPIAEPGKSLSDRLRQAAIDATAFLKLDGEKLVDLLHDAAAENEKLHELANRHLKNSICR